MAGDGITAATRTQQELDLSPAVWQMTQWRKALLVGHRMRQKRKRVNVYRKLILCTQELRCRGKCFKLECYSNGVRYRGMTTGRAYALSCRSACSQPQDTGGCCTTTLACALLTPPVQTCVISPGGLCIAPGKMFAMAVIHLQSRLHTSSRASRSQFYKYFQVVCLVAVCFVSGMGHVFQDDKLPKLGIQLKCLQLWICPCLRIQIQVVFLLVMLCVLSLKSWIKIGFLHDSTLSFKYDKNSNKIISNLIHKAKKQI